MANEETFADQLKKAISRPRSLGDHLLRAKLAFTMSSDDVWAEGLLYFHQIFKFLEGAMLQDGQSNLGKLLLPGMSRIDAFERDLLYYFGSNWSANYANTELVSQYLAHLEHIHSIDPDLLIPYVYHLYMGLFTGSQAIKQRRDVENVFSNNPIDFRPGEEVINFGVFKTSDLKIQMKMVINFIGETFDEQKKLRIFRECSNVFYFNNSLIKSIESTDRVMIEKIVFFLFGIVAMIIAHMLLLQ